MRKYTVIRKNDPCPRCGSKVTDTVRYIGEYAYMGDWLRCRSKNCSVHTQVFQPPFPKQQGDDGQAEDELQEQQNGYNQSRGL